MVGRVGHYRVAIAILLGGLLVATLLAVMLRPDLAKLADWAITSDPRASQATFTINPANDRPRAVYLPLHEGRVVASLNGQALPRLGPREPAEIDRYRSATVLKLPDGVSDAAALKLAAEQVRWPVGLGPVFVGPQRDLQEFAERSARSISGINLIMPVVTSLGLALGLVLIFLSGSPARYAYATGFLVCSMLAENDRILTLARISLRHFENYVGVAYCAFLLLAIGEWWDRPVAERRRIMMGAVAILAVLIGSDLWFGMGSPKTALLRVIAFVVPMATALGYWLTQIVRNWRSAAEEAMAAAACTLLGLIASLFNILRLYGSLESDTLLLVMFQTKILGGLALLALYGTSLWYEYHRYASLRREAQALNRIVSGGNLSADLEARKLKDEIERRAVSEERLRMTRDLHDGLSGQLLSLLLKARSGNIAASEVEHEVERSLADLRMIAAAIDDSEGALSGALETFRLRSIRQTAASGLELVWRQAPALADETLPPRSQLDLMRAMQEALTNALRHSGGKTVAFDLDSDGQSISVAISDDGIGLGSALASGVAGAGMRNIRHRIEKHGGTSKWQAGPDGDGLSVFLTLPLR